MPQLRADNDQTITRQLHSAENIEKVLKLLRRVETLDEEYIAWIESLPEAYAIQSVTWIDSEVSDLESSLVHPGIFTMWPIFAATTSGLASSSQCIFWRGRLKHTTAEISINQALIRYQAQLVHPSLYIACERMALHPTTSQETDTKMTKLNTNDPRSSIIISTVVSQLARSER